MQVVVDAKSYLYLNGTTLDYVTQGLKGGFTFVNPQREIELRLRHIVLGLEARLADGARTGLRRARCSFSGTRD